jgi:hypothetical protein
MAAKGVVGERVAEGPNKKPRRETQISMNGKDAGIPEEKPESYSRDSGRNLPRVECCERPTITAKREDSTQETASLMEAVLERENMKVAYARVVSNKGAPGVDQMTTSDLKAYLKKHWSQIKDELLAGRYQPNLVKQVEIPKPDGGVRKLGIPTVIDRLIQQALHQVLSPIFESNFSESSYGFRPGRNAHQAVLKAREYIAEGRKWVIDLDLEKFYVWINYFKLTEVRTILKTLDEWIRRKLRRIIWKQMKKPWTRRKALMKRGVNEEEASLTASSRKGAWRCSRTEAMHRAYPNSYFEEMGLVSLYQERLCL